MKGRVADEAIEACTRWLDSTWLARRIARATFGAARDVNVQRLSRDRVRRVHLLQVDGRSCILELSPRLGYLRNVVEATTTATRHGLRVARLLGSDTSRSGLLRRGTAYAVFEFVEGRHPRLDCPREELAAVATAYARMHAVCGARPGLGARRGWTVDDHLSAWSRLPGPARVAPGLSAWLARHRPGEPVGYQLVHGDPNRRNIFLTGDGEAVLIDLGGMQFGLAPFELVYLLLKYCDDDPARRAHFVGAYRKELGEGFASWERHGPFWLAGGLLERAHWLLRSAAHRRDAAKDAAKLRRAEHLLALAHRLAAELPDGTGDLDRILAYCHEAESGRAPEAASSGTR
jgi:Ser/Thr protein kinase RdoA (MazF antagonist)